MLSHDKVARTVAVAVISVMVAAVLGIVPSSAHSFALSDGNDTPGRLDIRTASVRHDGAAVVHTITTYETWPATALGQGILAVGVDKNLDGEPDRCAFVYYAGRLRGDLSNCGDRLLAHLKVTRPNGRSASIKIPTTWTGRLYRWVALSGYQAAGSCRDLCFDAAPNRGSGILHDLKPPAIAMSAKDISVWRGSTDGSFVFPFGVTDHPGAGIATWSVQRRPFLGGPWETVLSGSGAGSRSPTLAGSEGSQSVYRVRAVDKQGNVAAKERRVFVPWDDDSLAGLGTFVGATPVEDPEAYGGGYQSLDAGDAFSYGFVHPQEGSNWCWTTDVIGPGDGDWVVAVSIDGQFHHTVSASEIPDGARRVVLSVRLCLVNAPITLDFVVQSGTGFAVDAVSMKQSGHL